MVQMLRGGLSEPHATTQALFAYDLFRSKIEFGGKTGTSQNYSDGWFVGVSPNIIGGAWVGGEYRSVHFHSSSQGEGCHTALPIFGRFMEKALRDKNYQLPESAIQKTIPEDQQILLLPYCFSGGYVISGFNSG